MLKIASPQDLQQELRRLLAYCQEKNPSRQKLASELRELADRVAGDTDRRLTASFKVEKVRSAFPGTTVWLVKDPSQKVQQTFGTGDKIVGYVIHAKPHKERGYTRPEPYTAYVGEPSPGTLGKRFLYHEEEKLERPKEVGGFWDTSEIEKLEDAGHLGEGEANKLIDRVHGSLGGLDAALKAVQQAAH